MYKNIKQINICFSLFLLIFSSCTDVTTTTLVRVTAKNYDGRTLHVYIQGKKDTITSGENGVFEIAPACNFPEFVRIEVPGVKEQVVLLVDSLEQVVVQFDVNAIDATVMISGSPGSMELDTLNKHYTVTVQTLLGIKKLFDDASVATSTVGVDSMVAGFQQRYDSTISAEKDFLVEFIERHYTSMSAMSALFQSLDMTSGRPLVMDVPQAISYYEMVDSALQRRYPGSKTVDDFHQTVSSIKLSIVRDEQRPRSEPVVQYITEGSKAPAITLPNLAGTEVSLSQSRGKVVLLDFWASWCVPCRRKNPLLVRLHKRFGNQTFEVFLVSLDKSKQAWENAIKKDNLQWATQCCNFNFWNTRAVVDYGVKVIPATFLIDKRGIVRGINLPDDKLEATIERLLEE